MSTNSNEPLDLATIFYDQAVEFAGEYAESGSRASLEKALTLFWKVRDEYPESSLALRSQQYIVQVLEGQPAESVRYAREYTRLAKMFNSLPQQISAVDILCAAGLVDEAVAITLLVLNGDRLDISKAQDLRMHLAEVLVRAGATMKAVAVLESFASRQPNTGYRALLLLRAAEVAATVDEFTIEEKLLKCENVVAVPPFAIQARRAKELSNRILPYSRDNCWYCTKCNSLNSIAKDKDKKGHQIPESYRPSGGFAMGCVFTVGGSIFLTMIMASLGKNNSFGAGVCGVLIIIVWILGFTGIAGGVLAISLARQNRRQDMQHLSDSEFYNLAEISKLEKRLP